MRQSILGLLLLGAALFPLERLDWASEEPTNELEQAVFRFNEQAIRHEVGRAQPPLTPEAVVAAIRWELLPNSELQISNETRAALVTLIDTGEIAEQFELEFLTRYEPDWKTVFTVWSVRLRIPGGPHPGGTTCISIQERLIDSRVMGPAERRVVEAWSQRLSEGIGSLQRGRLRQQFLIDRERARAEDEQGDE